ncbi:MAG TPA: branched-chain amino acid ABC transporter permease [Desulfobacteraceae bacterium]|nr:branched-chain amino acid ABC transporter permease [Desulfobacteraceae bacterium]HPJ68150.1 branched-chain amino acid ABC transporter permease [Desulfobacteraceae bacterium]HPQ28942.1 branched-chain amino acid ABC transporter permease [Desulfobacteraceae bacterium]
MDIASTFGMSEIALQLLVGLSRSMILFIISAGLSLILGVLRVPNVAHGSLYMIGAFSAYSVNQIVGGASGFWLSLILAPLFVALVSFVAERVLFCHLYEREHLMLLLFTFALMLIFGDLVKFFWGVEYKSVTAPEVLKGSVMIFGLPFPAYNLFLLIIGPVVGFALWLFVNKTRIGKISKAASIDRMMVGALGINVSWVFCIAFVIGCFLAGLGGALIAPTMGITLGMDHAIIIEAFLIVVIGGLGNIWGALVGALIFGITHSIGVMLLPQFAIIFPYLAVVIVLIIWPKGLLKSVW